MTPFVQPALHLLHLAGRDDNNVHPTSPPSNTNVDVDMDMDMVADNFAARRLIYHAVQTNTYTTALFVVTVVLTTAVIVLRLSKNRATTFLPTCTSIRSEEVAVADKSNSSQIQGVSDHRQRVLDTVSVSVSASKNPTQTDLAPCVVFCDGSDNKPFQILKLTALPFGQAQGAPEHNPKQVTVPVPAPFIQSSFAKWQLRHQDRPRLPQFRSRQYQQLDPLLPVSRRHMPPGRLLVSSKSSKSIGNGMPRRHQLQLPQTQSRGVSSSTPNPASDPDGCLAPPEHLSDDLLGQSHRPSGTAIVNVPYSASIASLQLQVSSPKSSAAPARTNGDPSRNMDGGDTSWPKALATTEPGSRTAILSESPVITKSHSTKHPVRSDSNATGSIPRPRLSMDSSNSATPNQLPILPAMVPPLFALDMSENPSLFAFENRRRGSATSIPAGLDRGSSGIARLALGCHDDHSPYRGTTDADDSIVSEPSSAASGSLSRTSSATTPGTIPAASPASHCSILEQSGSWHHELNTAYSEGVNRSEPVPVPMRQVNNSRWRTEEFKAEVAHPSLKFHPVGPSSFPSSMPILPPPPPGSDNYGRDLTFLARHHSHMHDAEGDADHNAGHDDGLQHDEEAPSWMRHTRSFGGGVCLACLANGGGFYGANVPLEERRPR